MISENDAVAMPVMLTKQTIGASQAVGLKLTHTGHIGDALQLLPENRESSERRVAL
jgi:hypothetical protein